MSYNPNNPNGQGTMANSQPVVIASDQSTVGVKNYDSSGQTQYNFPAGFVRVTDEPTQIFYDSFDALDTINKWNATTTSGGGVAASVSGGRLTLGSGTLASGYAHMSSRPIFTPTVPSWLGVSFANKIEFPVTTNAYRFWGAGTVPGSPTTSTPLTDAYGFEIDTAGKLYAVVYSAGTKIYSQDLSSTGTNKQPVDSNYHRYIIYYRTDKTYFYIDGLSTPVATADFYSPASQILPVRFITIAGATPPSSSAVIDSTGLAVWDTGKNNQTISDGTYGWRKMSVTSAGTITVQGYQPSRFSGTVTTSSSVVGPVDMTSMNVVTVTVNGTYAGVSFVFEGSDDSTNWYSLQGVRTDSCVLETSATTLTNTARAWDIPIGGFSNFRVRATAYTSGTANIGVSAQCMPLEPAPTVGLAQVNGVALSTGNGVSGTGNLRINIASDNTAFSVISALSAGTNVVGKVGIDQTTVGTTNAVSLAQVGATTVATGNGVVGAGVQRVAIASDNTAFAVNSTLSAETTKVIGTVNVAAAQTIAVTQATASNLNATVTQQTLTKGTQGTTGVSTQDLKDAGRVAICLTSELTAAAAAETLATMTESRDGAAVSTFTSKTITSGKRIRFTHISLEIETLGSGTAPQRLYVRLRVNTAGATTTASPIQGVWCVVNSTAIVKSGAVATYNIPDGLEFAGNGTVTYGITITTPDFVATTGTAASKVTLIGFEY